MDDDSELNGLRNLSATCAAAPKFGRNGKALLLEAFANITDDFEFGANSNSTEAIPPNPNSSHNQQSPTVVLPRHIQLTSYDELLKLVPPDERPFIQYTNRLKVPRFCRQTEVQTLTGKYLEFLLRRMDLATKERCLKEIQQNSELRSIAISAALKHELELYSAIYNKQMYLKEIHAAIAKSEYINASLDLQPITEEAPIKERSVKEAPVEEESDEQASVEEVLVKETSVEKIPVKEASIEEATFEISSDDQIVESVDISEEPHQVIESMDLSEEPDHVSKSMDISEEPDHVSKSMDISEEPDHAPVVEEESSDDMKRSQILAFVKRTLDPFFSAGLIDRELYKQIAKKVVKKIMEAHPQDTSAKFLINESSQVTALIHKYIKYFKKKSSK